MLDAGVDFMCISTWTRVSLSDCNALITTESQAMHMRFGRGDRLMHTMNADDEAASAAAGRLRSDRVVVVGDEEEGRRRNWGRRRRKSRLPAQVATVSSTRLHHQINDEEHTHSTRTPRSCHPSHSPFARR